MQKKTAEHKKIELHRVFGHKVIVLIFLSTSTLLMQLIICVKEADTLKIIAPTIPRLENNVRIRINTRVC